MLLTLGVSSGDQREGIQTKLGPVITNYGRDREGGILQNDLHTPLHFYDTLRTKES